MTEFLIPRFIPNLGTHGNAWNAAATGAGGVSNAIDTFNLPFVSVFGNTSGASTITVQLSQDGSNFYDSGTTVAATVTISAKG